MASAVQARVCVFERVAPVLIEMITPPIWFNPAFIIRELWGRGAGLAAMPVRARRRAAQEPAGPR
jgi:hypothetical protein